MNRMLFYIEIGKPDSSFGSYSWSSAQPSKNFFLIADSFDEANRKAINHLPKILTENNSVLTSDGSLNVQSIDELNIKSIKLISDNVVI